MGDGGLVSSDFSFRRVLCQSELLEYESLLSILANVIICREEADINNWKPCPTVVLSSKSTAKGQKQC